MAVVYSSGNYHSVSADHADFTLPNGDWSIITIARPDTASGGQDIVSTGEWGTSTTYNLYQFDTVFGFKYEALAAEEIVTVSAGNWVLLVAQRSGGTVTLRSVPMGSTTVTSSGGVSASNSVNPSVTLHMGRRGDNGDAPFIGALSDVIIVPGQTISNADMQAIATGTAIDSFGWYASRVFWNIAGTSTQLDETGDHTINVTGTLTSTSDHASLVRFGDITETITQVTEVDTAQAFTEKKAKSVGQVTELDIPQAVTKLKKYSVGQVTELDIPQAVLVLQQRFIERVDEIDLSGVMRRNPLPVGTVTELNIAQTVAKIKTYSVGQVTELDIPQAVTARKSIVRVSEIDTSQAFTSKKVKAVTSVTELNIAQSVSYTRVYNVGQVTELDTPQAVTSKKSIVQATETDTAQAFTAKIIKLAGQVTELNIAQAVTKIGGAAPFITIEDGVRAIVNNLTLNASISATTTATGFSVNNLKTADKSEVWRSTAITKQELTFTWGAPQSVSGVGIAFSNLIAGSIVRVKFYTLAADPSQILNTEIVTMNYAPDPPAGYSTIGYISFPYGGGNYYSTFFEPISVEKIVIELTSPSNPDGYIEVSSVVIGPALRFTSGVDYGATLEFEERSQHSRSAAGDLRVTRGTQNKILNLTMGKLTPSDNTLINTLNRGVGKNQPVFLSALSDSATESKKNMWQVYGKIDSDMDFSYASHNRALSTIKIKEL